MTPGAPSATRELSMATVQDQETPLARPPTAMERFKDRSFTRLAGAASWATILLGVYIVGTIIHEAIPAIRDRGPGFLAERVWDANADRYGILPQIWGTLYSSILGVSIGSALGISIAIFLSERLLGGFVFRILKVFGVEFHRQWGKLPDRLENFLTITIELLAAIPSVV